MRKQCLLVNMCSEFCEHVTVIPEGVSDGELPHMATTEYMLEAPRPASPAHQAGRGMVVYCMDISGSMSVTTKLPDIQGRLSQMYFF